MLAKFIFRATLVICATLLSLGLVEFVLLPLSLAYLPLNIQAHLPQPLRSLAAPSKKGLMPQDYILVVGDSYANGNGDWLLGSDKWSNPTYSSVHLLHQYTGRDFITFAQTGAGHLRTFAAAPLEQFAFLQRTLLYKVEEPSEILAFIYEGNDFTDNFREPLKYCKKRCEVSDPYDSAYLPDLLYRKIMPYHKWYALSQELRWQHIFFLAQFVESVLTTSEIEVSQTWGKRASEKIGLNRVQINGVDLPFPDLAQGPALELSQEEMQLALRIYDFSLSTLRQHFPRSMLTIVYIPSPLSIYSIRGERVFAQSYFDRSTEYPTDKIQANSDLLANGSRAIAEAQGARFLDCRPSFRAAAAKEWLHGPIDWRHLNRRGQEVLARAISQHYK